MNTLKRLWRWIISPSPASRQLKLPGILKILLLAVLPGTFTLGCHVQLDRGGAYAPTNSVTGVVSADPALYAADATFAVNYDAIDTAFKFELQNRAMLENVSPAIKTTLDDLRPKVWDAVTRYNAARRAYVAAGTPASLSTLQDSLATVATVSQAVVAALPQPKPN